VTDGFLEDILFARVTERMYNKSLKNSIDANLLPTVQTCKGIVKGVWTFYLRTPRICRINKNIVQEISAELTTKQKDFLQNFGMVTAKTILKLYPKALVHTKSILFHAVGEVKFLTSDHPSIPCFYNNSRSLISKCDEHMVQKSILYYDEWPREVGLLCPLSPKWCIWTQGVEDNSSVNCIPLGSPQVQDLNQFIRASAERFVILPSVKKH